MSFPNDELPPRNSAYAGNFHCLFKLCPWLIRNPVHSQFRDHKPAPKNASESPQLHTFESTVEFDLGVRFSLGPWMFLIPLPGHAKTSATAEVEVVWDGEDPATRTRRFRTELKRLDSRPVRMGFGPFTQTAILKLSSQQASRGTTSVREQPDGRYDIASHFNVATSLSFDGGTTWHDAEDRSHRPCAAAMDLDPEPRFPEAPIG